MNHPERDMEVDVNQNTCRRQLQVTLPASWRQDEPAKGSLCRRTTPGTTEAGTAAEVKKNMTGALMKSTSLDVTIALK